MKDKNKIFFGEKGISSTSANHLANIAKQMVDQENAKLDATSFVTTQVKLLSSGSEAIIQTGNNDNFIKEIPGGVEMEDIVDYKVPMGIIGQIVHPFLVKPKLNEIFEYRRKKLIEMFGEFKG